MNRPQGIPNEIRNYEGPPRVLSGNMPEEAVFNRAGMPGRQSPADHYDRIFGPGNWTFETAAYAVQNEITAASHRESNNLIRQAASLAWAGLGRMTANGMALSTHVRTQPAFNQGDVVVYPDGDMQLAEQLRTV